MTPDYVVGFMTEALKVTLLLALPVLGFALIVGLIVSAFQSATQINEMTLVFVPKMLAVGVALLVFFPWMLQVLLEFTHEVFTSIIASIR